MIISDQSTWSQTWNLEWSNMPSLSDSECMRIYWNRKQNAHRHQMWMRENGSSLDFDFISLSNPAVDENLVADIVCCSSSSENDGACNVLINSNSLWMANLLNVSTFSCMYRLPFYYFHLLCAHHHHFGFASLCADRRSSEIQGTALGKCLWAWTCILYIYRSMPAGVARWACVT